MTSRSEIDKSFLGQGLAYPLHVTPRGEIAMASGETDIEQAICIILGTLPGERVMRPEFGCRVHELVFAPRDAATEGLVKHYVEQALGRWEPRIRVTDVIVANDPTHDGAIVAEIRYRINGTYDERSIVYPFFIAEEEAR